MNRTERIGRLGGLLASAVAVAPFVWLWVLQMNNARDPLTAQVRLDMAIWMAVFGTPWMIAAWLLWRAWWRQAGTELSARDGPGWLLAAAAATLPAGRRDWGAAMTTELAQVHGSAARWRFAAGCARAAVFPPRGSQAPVLVAGALAVTAIAATALATGAALPAGRVFSLTFVGLLGGVATLAVARSRRVGRAGPGPAIAGLALAGVAACLAATIYYLAEYPTYHRGHPPARLVSLPPVSAVVLAVGLAGCVWLALTPPRWLLPDRHARRFGAAMAVALVGGFVLDSRLIQPGLERGRPRADRLPDQRAPPGDPDRVGGGRRGRPVVPLEALGLRLGHRARRAAAHRRLAGRGAALGSGGSGDGPGRGRGAGGGRQPGERDLVDPGTPAAVGTSPGRDRRSRRQRSGPPPTRPRACGCGSFSLKGRRSTLLHRPPDEAPPCRQGDSYVLQLAHG